MLLRPASDRTYEKAAKEVLAAVTRVPAVQKTDRILGASRRQSQLKSGVPEDTGLDQANSDPLRHIPQTGLA